MRLLFCKFIMMTSLVACAASCTPEDASTNAKVPASASQLALKSPISAPSGVVEPAQGDSACALLTDGEVRQVLSSAGPGVRNTTALQYGVDGCQWETATGQIVITVQKAGVAGIEQEVRAELHGLVDPLKAGAVDRIEIHTIDAIPDHAITVIEKADAQRGILTDIALLAIQRDHRMAVLMLRGVGSDTPAQTLESLQAIGRKVGPRL